MQHAFTIPPVLINISILLQDVWLEIQWYYRHVDLKDVGVKYVVSFCNYFNYSDVLMKSALPRALVNMSLFSAIIYLSSISAVWRVSV